jgi:hypothetical protein
LIVIQVVVCFGFLKISPGSLRELPGRVLNESLRLVAHWNEIKFLFSECSHCNAAKLFH